MRSQILHELKIALMVTGIGMGIFASTLLFGMRVKACEVRDGVNTPIFSELVTMDRAEREALRNAQLSEEDATFDATFETTCQLTNNSPEVGSDFGELDLLAALVWAEAGDQDFIGQRIVADCVLNRVRSAEWPNSVEGVIYQSGQFSVVANGRLAAAAPTAENYEAARLALSGDHYDTNVIYFSMYYCANGNFAYQHGDHFIGY